MLVNFMLNLEPVGVSLFFGCFPDGAFFFCVACRFAVCFAFFTLPKKVAGRARARLHLKPDGPNTTQRAGDFLSEPMAWP